MSTNHRGAASEALATAWLLGQGFEVCRNVAASGPIDLVAISQDGDVTLIDVKTESNVGSFSLTPWQAKHGVRHIGVNLDTGAVRWLDPRPAIGDDDVIPCKNCRSLFKPYRRRQVFCCTACKTKFHSDCRPRKDDSNAGH